MNGAANDGWPAKPSVATACGRMMSGGPLVFPAVPLRDGFGGHPSLYSRTMACHPKLRSSEGWWAVTVSNRRPSRCKRDALPLS